MAVGGDGERVALAGRNAAAAAWRGSGRSTRRRSSAGAATAGAVTAACCADALARGVERVVLFTDLSNPAPNKVYQRIGFRPVSDHRVTRFQPSNQGRPLVEGRAHCGRSFGCGAAEGSCWCAEVELDDAARARLAASYDGCLCPECLNRAAAGTLPPPRLPLQARAPGGPAPRPR